MQRKKDISNIVRNYVKGKSSREELKEAISLFEDPYHNLELRPTLLELWNADVTEEVIQLKTEELSEVLNNVHHKINLEKENGLKSGTNKFIINILKIAAVLVVGLFLGLYINTLKKAEPVYYTSVAPKGSVAQMILPDNTMVYLNSGSKLKYLINENKNLREVSLEGEAWFQVTKNEKKPFVVHTPFYDVNVLGTEFNVKAYPADEKISTTLEKGSVKVTSTENFKIQNNLILKPGEQLVFNKETRAISVVNVNTKLFTSWKDNKLIFIKMSLKELIVLLERKYGVDIEVVDKSILNYHYTGTIKNETILEILNIIDHTLPIRYEIDGQKVKIYKK